MGEDNQLDESLAKILHRVAAWWTDPLVPARSVVTLRWGETDLTPFAQRLTVVGDDLQVVLTFRDGRQSHWSRRDAFRELFNEPLQGTTTDGWQFYAAAAGATRWSFETNQDGYTSTVTVNGSDWKLRAPDRVPTAWAASVTWDPPNYIGNLALDVDGGGFSRGHYYLRGPDCDYALIKRANNRWVLIVHERGTEATHEMLRRDLNALACSFGTPMSVSRLSGINADLQVVGVMGGAPIKRRRKGMPGQAPAPSLNELSALPVLYFEHLAMHVKAVGAEKAGGLTLATWYFLESLEEYSAESVIVKMTLAVIAAARYLQESEWPTVNDYTAFVGWLKAHDAELEAFERVDAKGVLRQRIASAAQDDPFGIVTTAMHRAGLDLLPDLAEALAWGMRALGGRPSEDERLYELLPKLRAIVSALIATATGYRGKISGWIKDERYIFYEPTPDGWWKCDEGAAPPYYRATIGEHVPEVGHLWPEVPLPSIPTTGPLALLNAHAASLSASTQGRVLAEIRPLPSDEHSAARRYEFVLRAARRRAAKVVLFLLNDGESSATVEGWKEPVSLSSPADVVHFLKSVAAADETRAAIERLLIASFEAEQDAEG